MKNLLLKLIVLAVAGIALVATSAIASPIFFQADNVTGAGTIDYGMISGTGLGINDAPVFSFQGQSGLPTNDISSFVPGNDYTIRVVLEGFQAKINPQSPWNNYGIDDIDATFGPYPIPGLPVGSLSAGTYGPLTWNLDWNTYSGSISYNFDYFSGPTTNQGVNAQLASLDQLYSNNHTADGTMNASIRWDHFRVELTPASVPEPATMLLFGTGLAGLAGVARRKTK